MGGQGSGRRADPVKKLTSNVASAGTSFIIPNLSGVKEDAKKTSPADITATGGGGGIDGEWTSGAGILYPTSSDIKTISGANIWSSGEISGANFYGDGSNLTNVSYSETDPQWSSQSGAYLKTVDENWPAQSGAYLKTADENWPAQSGAYLKIADENWPAQSGAYLKSSTAASTYETITHFDHLSGAYYTHEGEFDTLSGAFYTHEDQFDTLSGAYYTHEGEFDTLSGAYYTHSADSSDPHGSILTQTYMESSGDISGANIFVTDDYTTSGAAYVANAIFGTGSSPGSASNYPQGTIYFKYTA